MCLKKTSYNEKNCVKSVKSVFHDVAQNPKLNGEHLNIAHY